MISCFSAYGTGAAFAIRQIIDDRSARASSLGGSDTMRLSCVGAENVLVTRCSFTRRDPRAPGRTCAARRSARRACAQRRERERPRVVQRAGREVHRVLVQQVQLAEQREHDAAVGGRAQRALRLAGGARRVDHRRAALRRSLDHGRARCRAAPRARRPRPSNPAGVVAAEHDDRPHLRDAVADLGDERRLLGVDDHDRRVGVVDDVRISSALNRYDSGTATSSTLRAAWIVASTSSEFGPHHTSRSPGCMPGPQQPCASRFTSC